MAYGVGMALGQEAEEQVVSEWVPTDTFGARLALIRQQLGGWNVKRIATLCDVDDQSWRNWEKGPGKPRDYPTICRQIANATGANYEWLMVGGPLLTDRYPDYAQVRGALDLVHFDGPDQMTLDDAPRYDMPRERCLAPV